MGRREFARVERVRSDLAFGRRVEVEYTAVACQRTSESACATHRKKATYPVRSGGDLTRRWQGCSPNGALVLAGLSTAAYHSAQ